jgi:hypothetical protein
MQSIQEQRPPPCFTDLQCTTQPMPYILQYLPLTPHDHFMLPTNYLTEYSRRKNMLVKVDVRHLTHHFDTSLMLKIGDSFMPHQQIQ